MSKGKAELKRRAQAMLATLVERFPRCFTREQPKPLKIGIDRDIIAEMPGTVETLAAQTDLRLAMRLYTGSPAYLQALVEGATRVDLAGAPAGIVKAPHAGFAKYRLRRMGGRQ
jgi:sRNA-binding protein